MKLYYCGFNAFGQHPIKDVSSDSSRIIVFKLNEYPLKGIKDVTFSWSYVALISEDGVYVSGFVDGKPNQLKKLKIPDQQEIIQISASEHYALLTTVSGDCWQYRPLDDSWKKLHKFTKVETNAKAGEDQANADRVLKVCCGEKINAALSDNGVAYAIPSPLYTPEVRVIDVVCGLEHGLLLTETGLIYSWGAGSRGQLGHGELESEEIPREVNALAGMKVIHVAAGGWHSAAVTEWGDMYTWGWNNSGQLGFPSQTASKKVLSVIDEVKETKHNCAHKHQPLLSCSAKNNKTGCSDVELFKNEPIYFAEGSSSTMKMPSSKKQKVDAEGHNQEEVTILSLPTLLDWPGGIDVQVKAVSCGARHTVALLSDNTVWGCGWNAYGQLGESPCLIERSDEMRKINTSDMRISKIYCGCWSTGILVEDSNSDDMVIETTMSQHQGGC